MHPECSHGGPKRSVRGARLLPREQATRAHLLPRKQRHAREPLACRRARPRRPPRARRACAGERSGAPYMGGACFGDFGVVESVSRADTHRDIDGFPSSSASVRRPVVLGTTSYGWEMPPGRAKVVRVTGEGVACIAFRILFRPPPVRPRPMRMRRPERVSPSGGPQAYPERRSTTIALFVMPLTRGGESGHKCIHRVVPTALSPGAPCDQSTAKGEYATVRASGAAVRVRRGGKRGKRCPVETPAKPSDGPDRGFGPLRGHFEYPR